MTETSYEIKPIGIIRSELASREAAPRHASEGAPDAWVSRHTLIERGISR
jgi:hypothetical protein